MTTVLKSKLSSAFSINILLIFIGLFLIVPNAGAEVAQAPGNQELDFYDVNGFRSAKFGMTKADVKKAIRKDFKLKKDDIKEVKNTVEHTDIYVVNVSKVNVHAGPAQVAYIFGYKSKKLIQVNVAWGAAAVENGEKEIESLVIAGQDLIKYFAGYRYLENSLIVNRQLDNGQLLLLKAQDKDKETITLMVGEIAIDSKAEDKAEKDKEKVPFLRLSYIKDTKNPDIFEIEDKQF